MPCQPLFEISGQSGERHITELRQKRRFDFAEGIVQRMIHRLFDEAARTFGPMPHGQNRGGTDRAIDVGQRDGRGIACDRPAAAMPLLGPHEAVIAQTGHNTADDGRVRHHRLRELFRRGRLVQVNHMQEDVQDARQSAISLHATLYVT